METPILPRLGSSSLRNRRSISSSHSTKKQNHEAMIYLTYIIDHYDGPPDARRICSRIPLPMA